MATWARADTKPSYNFSEIGGSVDVTRQLSGKIPEANLPSYVDDVLEYNSKSNFPKSGETGKIYVDISTNLTYVPHEIPPLLLFFHTTRVCTFTHFLFLNYTGIKSVTTGKIVTIKTILS